MITAEELIIDLDNKEESKNFKLATVVELFDNDTAKVKFDGEDAPSEKQYAYLDSYIPKVNDRILLGALGGTYVILGKVNYNVPPSTEEEIDRYIFDLKTVNILKGLQVSGAFTVNEGMAIVGNVGVDGAITAVSLSASGNISGANISTPGTLTAGATTLASLNVSGTASANAITGNTVNANSYLNHAGMYLRFFGKNSYSTRQTVSNLSGTVDANIVASRLNSLLDALRGYGLIG